jgi:uncharacterized protein YdcH (DUF465 family)
MNDPMHKLQELDARHSELLDKLDLLDQDISRILREWTHLQGDFTEPVANA